MPKAGETGDKPVKAVKAKAKSEKTDKAKTPTAAKTAKAVKPKAGEKPVVAKASTAKSKSAKSTASTVPKQSARSPVGDAVPTLTAEQRRYYVEIAAYYIAERRGFGGGSQLEDWVQAEAEIDRLLREGILKP